MILFCFILICVGASVSLATPDKRPPTFEKDLASDPLIQHLLERVDMLERQGAKQASEIRSMKAEMSQQKGLMKRMRSKLHAKDKLIHGLLNEVRRPALDDSLSSNEGSKYSHSEMTPNRQETQHTKQMRRTVKRIQPVENVRVAFSAIFTDDHTQDGDRQNVVFDRVQTNVGNAYNLSTGVFIAPVSGIYVFSASILSSQNHSVHAYVKVNFKRKSMIYLKDDTREMASQTMVFELNRGDQVTIQGGRHANFTGNFPLFSSTTFSGFLLHETYPSITNIPLVG